MRRGLSAPVGIGPSCIIIILTPALSWKKKNKINKIKITLKTYKYLYIDEHGGPKSHLQLFDGVPSSANHKSDLTGRDQHLLHSGLTIAMETRAVSAAVHDLDQEPLGLPVGTIKKVSGGGVAGGGGGDGVTREATLTQCFLAFRSENMAAP